MSITKVIYFTTCNFSDIIIVMEVFFMTIGEKIYKFRNSLNLTQKQFAEKSGFSQSSVNFWENGKRQPKIEQLQKISSAFNVPIGTFIDSDLLGLTNSLLELYGNEPPKEAGTIAAHFDDDDFTDEELEEIKSFIEFVKSKRNN